MAVRPLPAKLARTRGTPDCKWRVCVDKHWPVSHNDLLKDHSDAKYDWDPELHVWWAPLYGLDVLAELEVRMRARLPRSTAVVAPPFCALMRSMARLCKLAANRREGGHPAGRRANRTC